MSVAVEFAKSVADKPLAPRRVSCMTVRDASQAEQLRTSKVETCLVNKSYYKSFAKGILLYFTLCFLKYFVSFLMLSSTYFLFLLEALAFVAQKFPGRIAPLVIL